MGRITVLSEYKKSKKPDNIMHFRPLSTGIGHKGNLFIYYYLSEANSEGRLPNLIFTCLLYIFNDFRFEFLRREQIEAFARKISPEDINLSVTEAATLEKANEENEFSEEYAQGYISYALLRHSARSFCENEEERQLLRQWHSYIICMIFPEIAAKQNKK